jgi:hypothetical protein
LWTWYFLHSYAASLQGCRAAFQMAQIKQNTPFEARKIADFSYFQTLHPGINLLLTFPHYAKVTQKIKKT